METENIQTVDNAAETTNDAVETKAPEMSPEQLAYLTLVQQGKENG